MTSSHNVCAIQIKSLEKWCILACILVSHFTANPVHVLLSDSFDSLAKLLFEKSFVKYFLSSRNPILANTAQKMKFSIKDFFSKCDQIRSVYKQTYGTEFFRTILILGKKPKNSSKMKFFG